MAYSVYAVYGKNYAMIYRQTSLDSHRQHKCIKIMIANISDNHSDFNIVPTVQTNGTTCVTSTSSSPASNTNGIPQEPHYFVVDTDSTPYAIDTCDNRVVVNDIKLLCNLKPSSN